MAGSGFGEAFGGEADRRLPDLAGVYRSGGTEIVLAIHPGGNAEYIGQIVYDTDRKVQPMKVACDVIKGCHGIVYHGTLANQEAVELQLEDKKLTVRYYSGRMLVLERAKMY